MPKALSLQDLEKAYEWVDKMYNSLSENERLGQLFVVALYTNKDEKHIKSIQELVLKEKIGGIILMQDDAEKSAELVNKFQNLSKTPMLVGIDAEWGLYQRFPKAHKFPWAMTLGAIQDNQLIYEMAGKIAQDAKRIGINWIFAPVVDVNTNPKNPIIGNRSFGSDVRNVIEKSLAYVNGLQDNGVLATIKHFPGHGDTDKDSHTELPVIKHEIERLDSIELAPFKALADKNIGGIMIAHLHVPAIEIEENTPATLSKEIISNLLKEKLKYKGLIITDALNMGAVSNQFEIGNLEKKAFEAGNDILLFSQNVILGKKNIRQAVSEGKISVSRVEESVKKILLTKYLLGLANIRQYDSKNIVYDLKNKTHSKISQKLYSNAITLLKDEKNLLPLKKDEMIYYIPLGEGDYKNFANTLKVNINLIIKKANQISDIPKEAKVIIGFHKYNFATSGVYKISDTDRKILHKLSKENDLILCVFGSPYILMDLDLRDISTVLVSYENNKLSQDATVETFFINTSKITGRLPIFIGEKYKNLSNQK